MNRAILSILFIFDSVEAIRVYMKLPEATGQFSKNSHLSDERVKLACLNTDKICKGGGVDVCAVKMAAGGRRYAHFENSCYLFMSNMCDHPGEGEVYAKDMSSSFDCIIFM